jgi:GMP reductase
MRIVEDVKLDFKDVLILPKRSALNSREDVVLHRTFKFKNSGQMWTGIPIVASNMDGVGEFAVADVLDSLSLLTCIVKHRPLADWLKFDNRNTSSFIVSLGIGKGDIERAVEIINSVNGRPRFACIDVANGYTQRFLDSIKKFRDLDKKDTTIIAGNVVTPEITEELILSGVDIVKVGIGSGSVCTTRKQAGVGYPQLSAIVECADAAHGLGGHVMSDGGCTVSGDVAKAFGAGADFVMLGGMLAGSDEGGSKVFYGMSSELAMNKYQGGVAEYRSSEGKVVHLDSRGPIVDIVKDILGGLRSACTYTGSRTLKELPKRTTFIRATQQLNQMFGS